MAQVRQLALWHAHDDAVAALTPLLDAAYDTAEQLGGGGVLVARGLPQGETLLRFGAALHAARGDDDAARVLLTEGGLRLPGVDVASLRDELTALRGGDAARLLDADLRAADDAERRGRPSASERLRVAVVASRDGRSASEAEDGLRAVEVTPLDPA